MTVAFFGLSVADPSTPWPERGTAETVLCERDGWERRWIPTVFQGKPATLEAMCRGEFAVHLMMGGDVGFAISLVATGYRLSYGGSVFARCADAMRAAEAMSASCREWGSVQTDGFTDQHRAAMRCIIEAAERRGEVLIDRVFPCSYA